MNKQKLYIHTDFLAQQFLTVLVDLVPRIKSRWCLIFPEDSKILKELASLFVENALDIELYVNFSQLKNPRNLLSELNFDSFTNYKNISIHKVVSGSLSTRDTMRIQSNTLVVQCDTLLLGETLLNGHGIALASIAVEKNKKIVCVPPEYFSFGYPGFELLLNSNSATVLNPKDFSS